MFIWNGSRFMRRQVSLRLSITGSFLKARVSSELPRRFLTYRDYTVSPGDVLPLGPGGQDFGPQDFGIVESWNARDIYRSRTHMCGQVGLDDIGKEVTVCGWVNTVRKFNGALQFIPVRDGSGDVQCVLSESVSYSLKSIASSLVQEAVVCVKGNVQARPNSDKIEVLIKDMRLISLPSSLSFSPANTRELPNEEARLKLRYLDLRRPAMQRNLQVRAECARRIRHVLEERDFMEVETPLLFKPTPEGAREFLVAARKPGHFYALPQSPQQYKQLLMASGVDRYFQIARCFRDEDLRADRQPEFTQIDIEMAYVAPKDVMAVAEAIVKDLWGQFRSPLPDTPFQTISYHDAMSRYGSDKPDLRHGNEIVDVSSHFIFPRLERELPGFRLHALCLKPQPNSPSLSAIKSATKTFQLPRTKLGASRISGEMKIPPPPQLLPLSPAEQSAWDSATQNAISSLLSCPNDILVWEYGVDSFQGGWTGLGKIRLQWNNSSYPSSQMDAFVWVLDFPLLAKVATSQEDHHSDFTTYAPVHHPFTAPRPEDFPLLFTAPDKVRAEHYDLVLNGVEIGGGSIRIHDPNLQEFIFQRVMQMTPEGISRFRHLLDALGSGCPPHGGIALGFDRLVAILCRASSLREVIAFPKSSSGADLTVGSPAVL